MIRPQAARRASRWSQCHKYGYIRDERLGVESYPYPVEEGQRYINLNPGHLFLQQPPKKGRDREAHLNYYASADNRERQTSHHETNKQQQHKSACTFN